MEKRVVKVITVSRVGKMSMYRFTNTRLIAHIDKIGSC
jgi:hypothetical protein